MFAEKYFCVRKGAEECNFGSFLLRDACKSDRSRQDLSNECLGTKLAFRYSRGGVPESLPEVRTEFGLSQDKHRGLGLPNG